MIVCACARAHIHTFTYRNTYTHICITHVEASGCPGLSIWCECLPGTNSLICVLPPLPLNANVLIACPHPKYILDVWRHHRPHPPSPILSACSPHLHTPPVYTQPKRWFVYTWYVRYADFHFLHCGVPFWATVFYQPRLHSYSSFILTFGGCIPIAECVVSCLH